MPFIPDPNTARVETVFSLEGQIVENVYHVDFGSEPDVTMLTDMAGVFIDWWNTNIRPLVVNALSLTSVKAKDLTVPDGLGVEVVTGLPISGAAAVAPLPNNVTLAIKWVTGFTGRSRRGRTYHLGITPGQLIDPNHIGSGPQADLKAAYDALVTAVEVAGASLVVASFFSGVIDHVPQPRAEAVNTIIDECSINTTLDSQRRRLPERGA